ncbi:MAG: hypothetical protein IJ689_05050 [Alphaproteobacteria bacterium]|nr:hypothetical protein [Alphaproteobacteria bacterium]
MRYFMLLALLLFSSTVKADDENIMIIIPQESDEVFNVEDMPDCNNTKLHQTVRSAIKEYLQNNLQGSITSLRQRRLILKNIDKYEEINIAEFDNAENYFVANELAMYKINRHLKEREMRLCRSWGQMPIYLLITPEDFRYKVDIINFIAPTEEGNNFSVLYTPEVKQYAPISEIETADTTENETKNKIDDTSADTDK